jgi:magnesium transporter
MNTQLISVDKNATVAEAINKLRQADIGDDMDVVFVVDNQGKFAGRVLISHLVIRADQDQDRIESLTDTNRIFVRVDSHRDEVKDLLQKHDLANVPVLDHSDQLVGRIVRNGNGEWT